MNSPDHVCNVAGPGRRPSRGTDEVGWATDDPQVLRQLEQYAMALEQGEAPDREALLAQHPEIADQLSVCLDGLEFVRRVVPQVRDQVADGSGAEPAAGDIHPLATLGDCRIEREIGRGGMGVVYEATQLSLGRRVALKVLPFAAVLDPKQLQRFKNEAQAAASLRHPNIVQVFSVGSQRGVHYYTMEFIEGQTLGQVIRQLLESRGDGEGMTGRRGERVTAPTPTDAPPHPVIQSPSHAADTQRRPQAVLSTQGSTRSPEFFRSVANLGIQAAEALEHAHAMGVVHRDVKPSNLMVDAYGHLWITDFGLAMTQTDTNLTMTGDLLGTLRYMSPEQVAGRRSVLDHRTDVYSLGITLYELLALQAAFGGENRQEVLRGILEVEPPRLRQVNESIPKDLETIVLKATAKELEARYATAAEFADDLQRYLEDKPIRARRPTLVERTTKWSRRHRPIVWSAVAILVVAVAALTLSTLLISANYRLARDAAADLLDRVERITRRAAEDRDMAQVEALVRYATNLEAKLPDEIRDSQKHRSRLASMHYHLGWCALWYQDYEAARTSLQQAVAICERLVDESPDQYGLDLARYHYQLADSLRATENFDEAERSYRRCRELFIEAGSSPLPHQDGGPTGEDLKFWCDEALASLERLEIERTIRELTEAIERDGNVPENYKRRGHAYVQSGQFDPAVADYVRAIELDPNWALPYGKRRDLYSREGDVDRLIESWTKMIQAEPRHAAIAYKHRGDAYSRGKTDQASAIQDYTRAVERDPGYSAAYRWRAFAYASRGDFDEAIADFTKTIHLEEALARGGSPEGQPVNAWHAPAYSWRGWVHRAKGDYEKAIRDFSRTITIGLDAERANAYAWRGRCRFEQSAVSEAVEDYTAAIRLHPTLILPYLWRSAARAKLGRMEDARSDLRKAARIQPDDLISITEAARFLATCPVVELRDTDRALQLAREMKRMMTKSPFAWIILGMAQYSAGNFDEARNELQKHAETPSFRQAEGLFFLSMTCAKLGDEEAARHWYDRAVGRMEKLHAGHAEYRQFRAEAAELLGISESPPTEKEEPTELKSRTT